MRAFALQDASPVDEPIEPSRVPGTTMRRTRGSRGRVTWALDQLDGVKLAIDIFRTEIDLVMGQIGCPSLDQLGPDFLWREDRSRNV